MNCAIIPIGDHCAPSVLLKELGLRQASYPFDWVTFGEQLYMTNVSYNLSLIQRLFADESLDSIVSEYLGSALTSTDRINTTSTMHFPHDNFNEDITAKYSRRFERFCNDATANPCLFVYVTRYSSIPIDDICSFLDAVKNRNSNAVHLLIIGGKDATIDIPEKYSTTITYTYIPYLTEHFYGYDYTHFRPQIKAYFSKIVPNLTAMLAYKSR